jgi:crotonobetainyl-CoA:carnitine CoA-transferase CaiB-like acyl-CoA transferase
MGALSGIRVLDLADETGAYCGKLLGDLGADVIKVEPPGGDPMRGIGPFFAGVPDRNRSVFFWHYNTSKRSAVLDLEEPSGRQQFLHLVDGADIALTSGTPGSLARRGLDYRTLTGRNPHLIVGVVTGFGLDGPRAEWKSCDTVAQALGGMMFVNGHPDEPPLRSFGLQAYQSASMHAAIGVLLALLERERSGRGQEVEVSLQECVVAALEHVSGLFHQDGHIEFRRGTLHWTRYFRVGTCRDGYVLHGSLGDWTSLVEWVKADGKAEDLDGPEWEDFAYRQQNCLHLFDVLDAWARDYSALALVEAAQLRRLPYAVVSPPEAVCENPHLQARGFFVPVKHDELSRSFSYPGAPYGFSQTPWCVSRRPPLIGEHTDEVLFELSRLRNECGKGSSARLELADKRSRSSTPLAASGLQERVHPTSSLRTAWRADDTAWRSLDGVRVLDFTWVVAGPVATRILADHGAEVIKIERRDSLDLGSRRGGLTGNLNRGKRSVVVNMNDPRGLDLVRALVRESDIVIDNFSARVMGNWGLDYAALVRIRPDIIAVSVSGFGHSGPYRDCVSYGPTIQALAGYTHAMRHPGGEPAGWGFSYSDMVAGHTAALATLIALWHKRRSGEGQFVDVSQFEAAVALVGPSLLDVLVNGTAPEPAGNRSPERPAAPHGVYRCRDLPDDAPAVDRWCAICVFTEEEWSRFVEVLGRPAWAKDERFATLESRLANSNELDTLVAQWTRQRTAEEVMGSLQAVGVAAGLVANARDLCARDPHLCQRGYWVAVESPEGDCVTLDGVSPSLSRTPGRILAPGPLLGEHTTLVLRNVLRMEESEIELLKREGVVAS